jgi:TolB-like protein
MRSLLCAALCALSLGGCAVNNHTVCALSYDVIAPEAECKHLARAIPEFLTHELSSTAEIRVQDPQDAERYLARRWAPPETWRLRRLGRALGADYLILGSVTKLEDQFIIESRLFSVARGHVVPGTAHRETCQSESEIPEHVEAIADHMRYQILARVQPRSQAAAR